MTTFNNVTITKKANVYFDGQVSSRTIEFADGTIKTLGIMLPGEYTFNTGDKELMEITSGDMEVRLPDTDTWQAFRDGESFEVPANSQFSVKVNSVSDYICSFIK